MVQVVKIQFPEITLQTRDAHKLRGYFGNLFMEHSSLLHNHYDTGELRYQYPLVQYKVLDHVPTLIALNEGAQLLTQLFLQIRKLEINGREYQIMSKNIKSELAIVGYSEDLHEYTFQTLWMGLNQDNHLKYIKEKLTEEKAIILNRIITGNVLSFFKSMNIFLESGQRLMVRCKMREKRTRFKDKDMLAFSGRFIVNANLPSGVGLGKAVSRGFGAIKKT